MAMRVATWNLEWATPTSWRTAEILGRIDECAAEVVCLTETHDMLLSGNGHTICSGPDYGYPKKKGRRKVMLWSREPWSQVDDVGIDSMPPGRFVSGVTETSLGEVEVIGVCIPWFGSRTEARRGEGRKKWWQDHGDYLVGLAEVLRRRYSKRLVVMGDFNQVMGPRSRAPAELQSALAEALSQGMTVATADLEFQGRRCIDHIALGEDLDAESVGVIGNGHDGRNLTDHFGTFADVRARPG